MPVNPAKQTKQPHVVQEIFKGIDEVQPPVLLAGQRGFAYSYGKWVPCEVQRVAIHRAGLERLWTWRYHITIGGAHVVRDGSERRIGVMRARKDKRDGD